MIYFINEISNIVDICYIINTVVDPIRRPELKLNKGAIGSPQEIMIDQS